MIQFVNEAIERTRALTGESPADVVRKALVRAELPLYSVGAGTAGLAAANAQKDRKVPTAGRRSSRLSYPQPRHPLLRNWHAERFKSLRALWGCRTTPPEIFLSA